MEIQGYKKFRFRFRKNIVLEIIEQATKNLGFDFENSLKNIGYKMSLNYYLFFMWYDPIFVAFTLGNATFTCIDNVLNVVFPNSLGIICLVH